MKRVIDANGDNRTNSDQLTQMVAANGDSVVNGGGER